VPRKRGKARHVSTAPAVYPQSPTSPEARHPTPPDSTTANWPPALWSSSQWLHSPVIGVVQPVGSGGAGRRLGGHLGGRAPGERDIRVVHAFAFILSKVNLVWFFPTYFFFVDHVVVFTDV
jgi:hypothetical protein